MFRVKGITVIIVVALGICLSCAKDEDAGGLAKIGSRVIRDEDLAARLEGMPPFMMEQLQTAEGKERLLKAIVEEEIIVKEARARGLDKSDEFKKEISMRERDLLVRLFYEKVIETEAAPTDSEVVAFYESNTKEFTTPPSVKGRHILVETEQEALNIRKQLEAGADFAELASKHSLDPMTKDRDGVMHGEIVKGAAIKGLGNVPELVDACFELEVGQLSQPIRTEKGYHVVLIDEKKPEVVKPLDEVRADIVTTLTYENRDASRDKILNDLRSKYNVVFLSESSGPVRTPEQLFKIASEESNPTRKIEYYEQFAEQFPDDERVYEARFMIGFTLAEDLKDYDAAEEAFREFLKQYPETDLSDDAEWMIENMRSGEQPEFGSD